MAYPGQHQQQGFDPNNPQFYTANSQPQHPGQYHHQQPPPGQYGQPVQPMGGYQQQVGGGYIQQPMQQQGGGQFYYNEQQKGVPMGQQPMNGQYGMQGGTMPCPECNGSGEIGCCDLQRCTRCCTGCCQICAGCFCACCLDAVMPEAGIADDVAQDAGILLGCYKGCNTCFGSKCSNCKGRGVVVAGPPGRQGMF